MFNGSGKMNEPRRRKKIEEPKTLSREEQKAIRDALLKRKLAKEIAIEIFIGASIHADVQAFQDSDERMDHLSSYAIDSAMAFVEKWYERTSIQNEQ